MGAQLCSGRSRRNSMPPPNYSVNDDSLLKEDVYSNFSQDGLHEFSTDDKLVTQKMNKERRRDTQYDSRGHQLQKQL